MRKPKLPTDFSMTIDTTEVKKELDIVLSKLKQIVKLKKELGLK